MTSRPDEGGRQAQPGADKGRSVPNTPGECTRAREGVPILARQRPDAKTIVGGTPIESDQRHRPMRHGADEIVDAYRAVAESRRSGIGASVTGSWPVSL